MQKSFGTFAKKVQKRFLRTLFGRLLLKKTQRKSLDFRIPGFWTSQNDKKVIIYINDNDGDC
jgi:hypothetical protein